MLEHFFEHKSEYAGKCETEIVADICSKFRQVNDGRRDNGNRPQQLRGGSSSSNGSARRRPNSIPEVEQIENDLSLDDAEQNAHFEHSYPRQFFS